MDDIPWSLIIVGIIAVIGIIGLIQGWIPKEMIFGKSEKTPAKKTVKKSVKKKGKK